jgi:RimJ/RimL family protein N-acetyltransferase
MAANESVYYYNTSPRRVCSFRPVISTERLTLTIWDDQDPAHEAWALEFFADEAIHSSLGKPLFHNLERIRAYRASTLLMPEHTPSRLPVSGAAVWFVRLGSDNPDGKPIGMINVCCRGLSIPTDIGWGLMKAYHGQGYASEAALAIASYILDDFQGGYRNSNPPCGLVATLNEKNMASRSVALKIGMIRMGEVLFEGSEEPIPIYAIPGLGTPQFTTATTMNVFGYGEAGRRTVKLLWGQEEMPKNAWGPPKTEEMTT